MPPIIIAVVAAAASAIIATAPAIIAALGVTGAIIAGAVVGAVIAAGLGMALQGSAPKSAPLAAQASDQKIMVRGSVAPRRVIYGEAKVSGPILYATSTGPDLEVLHLVIALAGHSVDSIQTVWINDDPILPGEIVDGSVVAGKYAGKVMIGKYLGSHTTADLTLIAETTDGWDADHKLLGIAYLYVRLTYNADLFQGLPNISALVRGKNDILDPRSNTTGYSTNWSLCVLDYLRSEFGLACAADELDVDSFIASANLSDELVPLNTGGTVTQPRYTTNGTFTLDAAPIDIMEDLLGAGAGALVYVAGQYRLHGGAYVAPSDTLSERDFAGPVELQTMPPRDSLFNSVRGTFVDPERFYQPSEFPPMQDPAALAADGEEIWRDIELPFVTDSTRAQRLARQTLYRTRNPLTLRAPLRYAAIRFSVWQTVAVTLADFGWTAKPFRISGFNFSAADGGCTVTLTEEQVASYAWLYDLALAVPDSPNTTLIDPLTIPAPTNVVVVPSTAVQADGSIAPALDVSWTPAAHAFVIAHEVQWQVPGGEWLSRDVAMPTAFAVLEPVISRVVYSVRVRATTGLARGPWSATATPTAGADTTAPAVPTGVTATGVLRGVSLSWVLPADRDLAAIEIFEGATSASSSRVLIGETRASVFLRAGLLPSTTRFYWVRSRDTTGNLSGFVGPITGTTSFLVTNDIDDFILTAAKFAAGIAPVVLIDNLSATAADNTTALNKADGKLYTRVAGQWIATIQPLGPGGTLTSAQINDVAASKLSGTIPLAAYGNNRPIEILGALPSTGNFLGRVVLLTTDKKTYTWTDATATTGTTFWSREVDGGDVKAGSLLNAAFPTNLRPVEILSALPSTGNFLGRLVLLTTDQKTYRWTSATTTGTTFWSVAVDASDITTGQLAAGRIAANTVSSRELIIGDFSNRADNGLFANGAVGWTSSAGGALPTGVSIATADAANAYLGAGYLRIAGAASGVLARNTNLFPVVAGDKYFLRGRAKCDAGTTQALQLRVNWFSADGVTSVGTAAVTFPTSSTVYTVQQAAPADIANLTAPATADFGVIEVFASAAISAGGWRLGEAYLARQSGGELIVDGSVTATKANIADLKANILTAGSVTTAHLSVGSGNVVWNSTCTRTADGWVTGGIGTGMVPVIGSAMAAGSAAWVPRGLGGGYLRVPTVVVPAGKGAVADWRPDPNFLGVPCTPGDRMQARALLGTHRCAGRLDLLFIDAGNAQVGAVVSTQTTAQPGGLNDSDFASHAVMGVAPAGTVLALLRITMNGNGGSDPYVFFTKAMLGKAPVNATEVGEWEPGGVTDISGGQLRTNSVVAEVIATDAIQARHMDANSVTAGTIAAGAINADEIFSAGVIKGRSLIGTESIVTQSVQVANLIIGTTKITGNAVTDVSVGSQGNSVTLNSPVNPGNMFAQAPLASIGVVIASGNDGKILVTVNPNVAGTSSYVWSDSAGGGGGGGAGGGE